MVSTPVLGYLRYLGPALEPCTSLPVSPAWCLLGAPVFRSVCLLHLTAPGVPFGTLQNLGSPSRLSSSSPSHPAHLSCLLAWTCLEPMGCTQALCASSWVVPGSFIGSFFALARVCEREPAPPMVSECPLEPSGLVHSASFIMPVCLPVFVCWSGLSTTQTPPIPKPALDGCVPIMLVTVPLALSLQKGTQLTRNPLLPAHQTHCFQQGGLASSNLASPTAVCITVCLPVCLIPAALFSTPFVARVSIAPLETPECPPLACESPANP